MRRLWWSLHARRWGDHEVAHDCSSAATSQDKTIGRKKSRSQKDRPCRGPCLFDEHAASVEPHIQLESRILDGRPVQKSFPRYYFGIPTESRPANCSAGFVFSASAQTARRFKAPRADTVSATDLDVQPGRSRRRMSRHSAHEPPVWIRGARLMTHTRKTGRIRSITAGDRLSAGIVENDGVLST